jgi:hypothetical protein
MKEKPVCVGITQKRTKAANFFFFTKKKRMMTWGALNEFVN